MATGPAPPVTLPTIVLQMSANADVVFGVYGLIKRETTLLIICIQSLRYCPSLVSVKKVVLCNEIV